MYAELYQYVFYPRHTSSYLSTRGFRDESESAFPKDARYYTPQSGLMSFCTYSRVSPYDFVCSLLP